MSTLFAESLRRLRIENGISQQQLSDLLFIDRSTVSKWESGDRMPDAAMLSRISAALGTDVSELLRFSVHDAEAPNVILVDDERIILSGTLPVLRQAMPGAEVVGFDDPAEAVEFVRGHRVALAFLDIEMGRVSGLDVCRSLLEIDAHINVVYLTAYKDYSFDAWATGACGFLLKPLRTDDVRTLLPRLRWPVRGLDAI